MSEELIHQPVRGSGVWEHFTVRDGLPDMKLECLLEDRHGTLWIGTHDRGVVRFDGNRFEGYATRDGLSGNRVFSVIEDGEGEVWLGTDGGVTRFDGARFEPVGSSSGERYGVYRGCGIDGQGRLWFGERLREGRPATVWRWDGGRLERIVLPGEGIIEGTVRCIVGDGTGGLWLGVSTQLYRYAGERFEEVVGPSSPFGYVWSLLVRSDGSLWIAGSAGVCVYDRGRLERLCERDRNCRALVEDGSGAVWLTTVEGRVWRHDGDGHRPLAQHGRPDQGRALAEDDMDNGGFRLIRDLHTELQGNLCVDRKGRLWVGTEGMGLYCYDPTRFEVFGERQGLASDQVYGLTEDAQGTVWVGTNAGLVGYDGKAFRIAEVEEERHILCVWVDGTHRLWMGTAGGTLYRYKNRVPVCVLRTDYLSLTSLTGDGEGRVWFGFSNIGGFGYWDNEAIRSFLSEPEEVYPREIGALLADGSGHLWVGTACPSRWEGLRCYDIDRLTTARTGLRSEEEGCFRAFTPADGLVEGAIGCLYEDRDGCLWVGSSEGMSCYDGTRFRTFTQADVLPQGMVTAITQTQDGTLWFGTEGGGVCCYDGGVFQTIQMPGDVGRNVVRALVSDGEGRMWFGTGGGLVRYTRHGEPPQVVVREVLADRTYRVEGTGAMEIPTTAGRISFRFEGRSSTQRVSHLVYRYRLSGYEGKWKQTQERQVDYPPLPPGEYRFGVQAVDCDLNYSERVEVRLTVTPDLRLVGLTEALRSSGVSDEFVGKSAALHKILIEAQEVARTDLTVLIAGETGTGKGLVARAVHGLSGRREGPFIPVSCGGIPEGLVESELFGHERGAFTGANSRKLGKVELAEGGTLFLDEIGDLAWPAQAKLLRLLEERTFERVGGMETLKADLRVIAATNRDLEQMVLEEQFREDLYFRLKVFPVRVPPLRERGEDIALLAAYFAARMAAHLNKPVVGLSPEAVSALQAYAWPGNVRELEHVVQRAVIVSQGSVIRPEEIELEFGGVPGVARPDVLSLAEHERQYIRRVLQRTGGKIHGPEGAAALLGVPESTLRSRIKRLGIVRR